MKKILKIVLVAGMLSYNALANNLTAIRYSLDIPVFASLSKSAPAEFVSFQSELKNISEKTVENSIIIEFYTDNMASFGALILSNNENLPPDIDPGYLKSPNEAFDSNTQKGWDVVHIER